MDGEFDRLLFFFCFASREGEGKRNETESVNLLVD
jgi:hypothetical protein